MPCQEGTQTLRGSRCNFPTFRAQFPIPYSSPPEVEANVVGNTRWPDRFSTEVVSVDEDGFSVKVQRLDRNCGWGQWPNLSWKAEGDQLPSPLGSCVIKNSCRNTLTAGYQFEIPYKDTPEICVWVRGEPRWPDRFSCSVTRSDRFGFNCLVRRLDRPGGWGQRPKMFWSVKGDPVPSAQGSQVVCNSRQNTVSVSITFPFPYCKIPTVFPWVRGDQRWPDRFSCTINRLDENGFDCLVRRLDGSSGWGQRPTLYWCTGGKTEVLDVDGSQVISNSRCNTMTTYTAFDLPYKKPPKVCAWVRGETRWPDRFSCVVTTTSIFGFECRVKRLDRSCGWGQKPKLHWNVTGTHVSQPQGSKNIGSSRTATVSTRIEFTVACTNVPKVIAWVIGDKRYPDRFDVDIETVGNTGFDCLITRLDQTRGWGQNPTIYWCVQEEEEEEVEEEEEEEEEEEADGSCEIGSSTEETKCIWIPFPIPFKKCPKSIVAWAKGARRWPDTFSVEVDLIKRNGFNCTITRTDEDTGWGQLPMLYYNTIGKKKPAKPDGFASLPSSSQNVFCQKFDFSATFLKPPQVCAWVVGDGNYPDKFDCTINQVSSTGFDCSIQRVDESCGWTQTPKLYWYVENEVEKPSTPQGTVEIAISDSSSVTGSVDFDVSYVTAPKLVVWLDIGQVLTGRFQVSITTFQETGFQYKIERLDSDDGWDSAFQLCWKATGKKAPEPDDEQEIECSDENNKVVRVEFRRPYVKAPKLTVWVRGQSNYPDRFALKQIKVDQLGFSCKIKRLDDDCGWNQKLKIFWKAKGEFGLPPQGAQKIGCSESNTLTGHLTYPLQYLEVFKLSAWIKGEITSSDKFEIDIQSADHCGFDFEITRTDKECGWETRPMLYWCVEGVPGPAHQGSCTVNASSCNSPKIWCVFPIPYANTPEVTVRAEGDERCPDKFSVDIDTVDENGFQCTITRLDQDCGWSQKPILYWSAKGNQVDSPEGCQEIGSSGCNAKACHIDFTIPYQTFPKVFAWVRGDTKYPDRFECDITKTDENGFDCTVKRLDQNIGWGQCPSLYWIIEGESASQGCDDVGSSCRNSKYIWVEFPVPFKSDPEVFARAEGDNKWRDRFSVTIGEIEEDGFYCTVKRTDCCWGWGQNPLLYWKAEGEQVSPEGSHEVGNSLCANKRVHVEFTEAFEKAPDLCVWARGDREYPDRFRCVISKIDLDGFDVLINREDRKCGWGQSPKIFWKTI